MKSLIYVLVLISIHLITTNCRNLMKKSIFIQNKQSPEQRDLNSISNSTVIIRDWYSVKLNTCNIKTCMPNFGMCTSTSICRCKKGYASVPELTNNISCSYKQKKQLTTFLLEMFIMGAGHIYRGSIILGVMKLLFIVLFPCMLLCLVFLGILVESDIKSQTCFLISSIAISIFYILTVIIWYMYDLISIGRNTYTDGNGVPLENW